MEPIALPQAVPVPTQERYTDALEAELIRWLDQRKTVGNHYDLLAYHMGWADESLRRCNGPRGKRFRPQLCLLACEAVGGDWRRALPIGAAIEFLHNFSLIHDDIEDHDEVRHHRSALWKLSGEPLAINAGDAMLALAGLAALSVPDVAAEFQRTALALTEGQYLDMTFESRADVTVEQYFEMIGLKTGALITFACWAGGLVGNASIDQLEALRRFGRHFGLAFQIFDDIRGIWAPVAQTGKAAGKDILNRKKSLPVLLALGAASGADAALLTGYYAQGALAAPEEVAQAIERLGVRPEVERSLQRHLDQAFQTLDSVQFEGSIGDELREVAGALVGRESE
ncbi:MAG TPA: polyprenyl synthetase family protein [Chloroflexota bacterium]|nr:polyprenyl synthetase family protein [Chloroflexota bacterium]